MYVATRGFELGNTSIRVHKGSQVLFDGMQVQIPGTPPVTMPSLRGAVKVGWLVSAESYNPAASTAGTRADIKIGPSEGGNPFDYGDGNKRKAAAAPPIERAEQEVMNVGDHAKAVQQHNESRNGYTGQSTVLEVAGPHGTPVRALSTTAKHLEGTKLSTVSQVLQEVEGIRVDPGKGITREEKVAQMSPQEAEDYLTAVASRRAAYDPEGAAAMLNQLSQPAQEEVVEEEGVKFSVTKKMAAAATVVDTTVVSPDVSRTIAKSICSDFPTNYNFSDPLRKKIARLQADYEDRPDVIRAVAAADTDPEVRARLLVEFPEVFFSPDSC